MEYRLRDIAKVIRTKNAGPYELTLDIMLKDEDAYRVIRDSGVISKETVARLYGIPEDDVICIVYFPNALAVKATIVRPRPFITIPRRLSVRRNGTSPSRGT